MRSKRKPQAVPYAALAQEIQTKVDEEIAATPTRNVASVLDGVLSEVTQERRIRAFLDIFNTLPEEARIKFLSAAFTDDETRAALATEKEQIINRQMKKDSIEALTRQAEASGSIDSTQIKADALLRIELFDVNDYDSDHPKTPAAFLRRAKFERILTLKTLGEGNFRLMRNEWVSIASDDIDPSPSPEIQEVIRLGTQVTSGENVQFDPVIHFGYPLEWSGIKQGVFSAWPFGREMQLMVGRLYIDNQEIMGANLPAFPY